MLLKAKGPVPGAGFVGVGFHPAGMIGQVMTVREVKKGPKGSFSLILT
jgi:hypothetical protein